MSNACCQEGACESDKTFALLLKLESPFALFTIRTLVALANAAMQASDW